MNFLVARLSAWAFKNPLVSERDCKGTPFFRTGKLFFDFFFKKQKEIRVLFFM